MFPIFKPGSIPSNFIVLQISYLFVKVYVRTNCNTIYSFLGIPANPRDRSPSPEPIYNSKGLRMNTREERTRNKLINQRNNAITKLKALDPTYQPPSSFKYKNLQLEDRVIIPAEVSLVNLSLSLAVIIRYVIKTVSLKEYPHINFMGALLGPRGNFLEELKTKTK